VATDEITLSDEVYRILQLDPKVPVTLATIDERIHPEGIPSLAELVARVRTEGRTFECEHRMLMPDGSVRYLHVVAHGTRDHQGQLEYIGAIQDVTQRRLSGEALGRARAELAHIARVTSLGALTASIAHEVNQPLSGIITNASTGLRMLASEPANVDGARETLRRTIRDGHRAAEVIARLRAMFSRRETASERVDLNEATREVVTLTLSELQRHRVVLRMQLAEDLPVVIGDRVQLQQVVLNLLLNASEAMSDIDDRPRELVVRSTLDGPDCVRLDVRDAGTGISPENVSQLFDAFYTTKSGGMGIGLSVSRSIIDSHHGRLVATPNDGPGATFSFSIPHGGEVVTRPYVAPASEAVSMTGAA
jgi:C4-dicarboxylate-specific signal transduction histidine kinase